MRQAGEDMGVGIVVTIVVLLLVLGLGGAGFLYFNAQSRRAELMAMEAMAQREAEIARVEAERAHAALEAVARGNDPAVPPGAPTEPGQLVNVHEGSLAWNYKIVDLEGGTLFVGADRNWVLLSHGPEGSPESVVFGLGCEPPRESQGALLVTAPNGVPVEMADARFQLVRSGLAEVLEPPAGITPLEGLVERLVLGRSDIQSEVLRASGAESLDAIGSGK